MMLLLLLLLMMMMMMMMTMMMMMMMIRRKKGQRIARNRRRTNLPKLLSKLRRQKLSLNQQKHPNLPPKQSRKLLNLLKLPNLNQRKPRPQSLPRLVTNSLFLWVKEAAAVEDGTRPHSQ